MINVEEHEDGSFTISWDENDPEESIFNDWTKEDFIDFFKYRIAQDQSEKEYVGKNAGKFGEKSPETSNVSEATEEDYQDFWEGDDISEQDFDEKYDNYIQSTNEDTYWEIPPLQEGGYPTKDDRLWEG
ncbi:hypothetical protein [Synechococcus phage S-H25]|nr:hypothetical protein [Synechococcus phage S-H25]